MKRDKSGGAPEALPLQYREAPVSDVNVDKRTLDVVYTTGAAVRRQRWTGWDTSVPFDEVLNVSHEAINSTRLNAGAPVLDSHRTWGGMAAQVGVVDRAWIEGNKGLATIRFPAKGVDPNADRLFALASDKIVRNISVGYSLDKVRTVPATADQVEQRIIERWTPHEISFVTIPADAGAQVRGEGQGETAPVYPVEFVNRAAPDQPPGENMNEEEKRALEARQAADRAAAEQAEAARKAAEAAEATRKANETAMAAERERSGEITSLSLRHKMPEAFAAEHIKKGTALDEVRKLVLDDVAKRSAATRISAVQVTRDEGDTIRKAIETAVLLRARPDAFKGKDGDQAVRDAISAARPWRGMRLMEMGRVFLEEAHGVKLRGLGNLELATVVLGMNRDSSVLSTRDSGGMLSTSDFSNILANVIVKRLRDAYLVAPQNWKLIARQSNNPDFKTKSVVQLSNLPKLGLIKEGGEYQYAGMADGAENYALATYGKIVTLTRQALINDDLGAFDRIPTLLGRAAAENEAAIVWALFTTNSGNGQAMSDGFNLFDATNHSNLAGSGGAIAIATLNAGRAAMRKQKGFAAAAADAEPLNLTPRYLIVSPDKETEAQQFLATTLYPSSGSGVNPFAGSMLQITEARLTGNAWYLAADPQTIDTIEYAYLEGEEGLYTETRIGFEQDGIEIKARDDFAAHVIDYRGFYKDPGN